VPTSPPNDDDDDAEAGEEADDESDEEPSSADDRRRPDQANAVAFERETVSRTLACSSLSLGALALAAAAA
jgi:hypothetical protein